MQRQYLCNIFIVFTLNFTIMRKYLLLLFVFILLTGTSCEEKIDVEKEKEAVIETVKSLVNDRNALDFEAYMNYWVDEPYAFLTSTGKNGHDFMDLADLKMKGKEQFDKLLVAQEEGTYTLKIEPFDFNVKVYKESAWVTFKNKWTKVIKETEETEDLGETFLIVSLEKHNEEWKIAFINAIILFSYEEEPEIVEIVETE